MLKLFCPRDDLIVAFSRSSVILFHVEVGKIHEIDLHSEIAKQSREKLVQTLAVQQHPRQENIYFCLTQVGKNSFVNSISVEGLNSESNENLKLTALDCLPISKSLKKSVSVSNLHVSCTDFAVGWDESKDCSNERFNGCSFFFLFMFFSSPKSDLKVRPWSVFSTHLRNSETFIIDKTVFDGDINSRDRHITSDLENHLIIASGKVLVVYDIKTGKQVSQKLKSSIRTLTCKPNTFKVISKKLLVACGCRGGEIAVLKFRKVSRNKCKVSYSHWHSKQINSLNLSIDGTQLLSGGEECVLVSWLLNDLENRSFIPRLNSSITSVVFNKSCTKQFCSTESGSLFVISNESKTIERVISLLALKSNKLHHKDMLHKMKIRKQLLRYVQLNSKNVIIHNSSVNNLSFYEDTTGKGLLEVNVTGRNLIRLRDRNFKNYFEISAVEIQKVAETQYFLFTVETNYEKEISILKLWQLRIPEDTFELSCNLQTIVHDPHKTSIENIELSRCGQLIFTSSVVSEMKIWKRQMKDGEKGKQISLTCVFRIDYADYFISPVKVALIGRFSSDSSLLICSLQKTLRFFSLETEDKPTSFIYNYTMPVKNNIIDIKLLDDYPVACVLVESEGLFLYDFYNRMMLWSFKLNISSIQIRRKGIFCAHNNVVVISVFNPVEKSAILKRTLVFKQKINRFAISGDGNGVVAISPLGKIEVMNLLGKDRRLEESEKLKTLANHQNQIIFKRKLSHPYLTPVKKQKHMTMKNTAKENIELLSTLQNISSENLPSVDKLLTRIIRKR